MTRPPVLESLSLLPSGPEFRQSPIDFSVRTVGPSWLGYRHGWTTDRRPGRRGNSGGLSWDLGVSLRGSRDGFPTTVKAPLSLPPDLDFLSGVYVLPRSRRPSPLSCTFLCLRTLVNQNESTSCAVYLGPGLPVVSASPIHHLSDSRVVSRT